MTPVPSIPRPKNTLFIILSALLVPFGMIAASAEAHAAIAEIKVDGPLREPGICPGPDGWYYLTGTGGSPSAPEHGEVSFDNNDGIRLWRSKDLQNWEPLGKVWDIVMPQVTSLNKDWWRLLQVKPHEPFAKPVRGVTAPEIHYLKETFFIIFAISEQGCGILRSTTGKPEGPYELLKTAVGSHGMTQPLLSEGASPSLFQDDDGQVYLLWGDGWIAPLNDTLTAITAEPRQLRSEGDAAVARLGHRGFHLVKWNGRYLLTAEKLLANDGSPMSAVFAASADTLFGPYTKPALMIPNSGQTTVFRGPDNRYFATFWGNDPAALLLHRPGLIELQVRDDQVPQIPAGTETALKADSAEAKTLYAPPVLPQTTPKPVAAPPKGQDKTISRQEFIPNQEQIAPVLDHPLRHPSICRGPDGAFYLTGTDGTPAVAGGTKTDFENNDGIRIWRSTDLTDWTLVGKVFDITDTNPAFADKPWWSHSVADPHIPGKPLTRGVYAPEIHYFNETFYICFSIGQQGCGILKSTSGKAEGPYEDLGQIVAEGGSPSLFQDSDGSIHLLWGNGWIARLQEDMKGLAEKPRQLRCASVPINPVKSKKDAAGTAKPADHPLRVGQGGYFLFKEKDTYYLTAEQREYVEGTSSPWVQVASAKTLHGPYDIREWMLAYSGQTTVFAGPNDTHYATWSGACRDAAFLDRPAILPLRWEDRNALANNQKVRLPRMMPGIVVERGPWHQLVPVTEHGMRDVMCMLAPDGYYYYAGSLVDPHFAGRLVVFRSRDLVTWEEKQLLTIDDLDWLSTVAERKAAGAKRNGGGLDDKFMDVEIHFVKGTFYVVYALYRGDYKSTDPKKKDGGPIVMRSTSGTIDGPWEHLDYGFSQGHFFEDDDGTVYAASAAFGLDVMNPDMLGFDKARRMSALPADGSYPFTDVGGYLRKIEGKYAFFSCGQGSISELKAGASARFYPYHYIWSDRPTGPWRRGDVGVPNGGHGGLFQDKQGRWWAAFFNTADEDSLRNWNVIPGIVPLETKLLDGELIIRVAEELPADIAEALRKQRAGRAAQVEAQPLGIIHHEKNQMAYQTMCGY